MILITDRNEEIYYMRNTLVQVYRTALTHGQVGDSRFGLLVDMNSPCYRHVHGKSVI